MGLIENYDKYIGIWECSKQLYRDFFMNKFPTDTRNLANNMPPLRLLDD